MTLSEWAEALASGEIELDEKLVKKGFDSSFGRTLVAEWHPTKNGDLTPQDVMAGTSKKIWWKHADPSCVVPGGHEWEREVYHRSGSGSGCSACSGKAVVAGVNDMATTHPELAADFHPTKNVGLTPQSVMAGTNKKIWWKHSDPNCVDPKGYDWEATGNTRAWAGQGCPACGGRATVVGVNDMASTHPELASEWHPTKNGDLTPQEVKARSGKKVWWKHLNGECVVPGGHEWEAVSASRADGVGCPACTNKTIVVGANDLMTTNPDIAAEWHPVKNDDLTPSDVVAGSGKKVWWKHTDPSCAFPGGHEWQAPISRRSSGGGCPACAVNAKSHLVGVNDMASTHPELAADWHPTKNGDLTPQNVRANTSKSIWWKHADPACVVPGGHEWSTSGNNRAAGGGTGCPACSGRATVAGSNDLATTRPDIAADWHPTKNGDLTPSDVVAGTNKKIWWKHADSSCVVPGGHEWEASSNSRTSGNKSGCPACNRGWGVDAVRQFIITMVEGGHIGSLTQAELYTLAQQNGLLRSKNVGAAVAGLASGKSINDFADSLDDDGDDPMAAAMADPEAFADHVLGNVSDEDMDDDSFEDTEVGDADMNVVSNDGYQDNNPSTDALPGQVVEQTLRTADALFATVDEEMMEYFIAARLHALWTQAYKDPEAALAAAESYRSCDA
jgi:hypothetical protein